MAAKDEDDIDDSDTFINNIFHRGSDTEDSDVDDDEEEKPENDEEIKEKEQQQQEEEKEEEKQHYLQSIDAFVKVRVLHSLGLSFQLWPAASTLVNLLDQQTHNNNNNNANPVLSPIFNNNKSTDSSSSSVRRRPLRILELGSGTGLVGICAAAILGSFVTLTDLPHVLPNLQFNAASNSSVVSLRGGNVNVASLRWGETEDFDSIGREFDIILGTDVVYHDHLFDPLLQTLKFFLNGRDGDGGSNEMVFIMAHLRRWKKDSVFFKKARKMFNVETLHTDPPSHGSRTGVVVYKFAGKNHLRPPPPPQVQSKSTIGNETVPPPMDG